MKTFINNRFAFSFVLLLICSSLFAQTQLGEDIDGAMEGDQCGGAVAISAQGTIVVIGSEQSNENASNSGHVRVFEYSGGAWNKLGENIVGEENDQWGDQVSMSDDGLRILVSSSASSFNQFQSGLVRAYEWNSNTWEQLGQNLFGEQSFDGFGNFIDMSSDGNVIAVGYDGGDSEGIVTVYELMGDIWVQRGSIISGVMPDDRSERLALSADGSTIVIGATGNDTNGVNAGHVRVFEYQGTDWLQKGGEILGDFSEDRFGSSVDIFQLMEILLQ